MTRDELAALFADVLGLRIRPVEIDTLLTAVEKYVDNRLMLVLLDVAPALATGPGVGE